MGRAIGSLFDHVGCGEGHDIHKQPLDTTKTSKKGRLGLYREDGKWFTGQESAPHVNNLVTVFENGEIKKDYHFDEIRENAS